jgi:hypothetical protein
MNILSQVGNTRGADTPYLDIRFVFVLFASLFMVLATELRKLLLSTCRHALVTGPEAEARNARER